MTGQRSGLLGLAGVAAAVALAYGNSFGTGLVFDSRVLIAENPMLRQASAANVGFLLTHDYWQPMSTDGLYRPLTTLSYLFNYAVLGSAAEPFGYHVVNLLLHLACTALVSALVWTLTRRAWPAVLGAAVFGLHPVATEAVTNVVGRADLLAALGVLGGLLCHLHAVASEGRRRTAWSAALVVAAVVAFFSKESGLVLLPVLVVYDLVFRRDAFRGARAVRDYEGPLSVLLVYGAIRWYVARTGLPAEDISPVDNPIVEASFWAGRLTALKVLGHQLWQLLFPLSLSADYSFRQVPVMSWPPGSWEDWKLVPAVVAIAAAAWATVRERTRDRAFFFLALLAFVTLLPTANLLTIIGSITADRFLYLPLAGFAGAAALTAERLARGRDDSTVMSIIVLVLVACTWRTWVRNQDWTDELGLWSSAASESPASAKAHKAYAAALFASDPRHAAIERVIAEGEEAVKIRPDYLGALVDLGGYYVTRGDLAGEGQGRPWYEHGVDVLEQARVLQARASRRFIEKMLARGTPAAQIPDLENDALYGNLALAYERSGRLDEALEAYDRRRRHDPANPTRYVDVSAVLAQLGRWEDASIALFEALAVDPDAHDAAVRLVDMYRRFYADGHAIVEQDADHVTVNLSDPVVHRHRCRAYLGLADIYMRGKMPEAAARVRKLGADFCIAEDTTPPASRP